METKTHRVFEQSRTLGSSDDAKYLLLFDKDANRVAIDVTNGAEVLRIEGELIFSLEREGQGYKLLTSKAVPSRGAAGTLRRYDWEPGQQPRLLQESSVFGYPRGGADLAYAVICSARGGSVYRHDRIKRDWPEWLRRLLHVIRVDEFDQEWHEYDFGSGALLRSWCINIGYGSPAEHHLASRRLYTGAEGGFLTAWDLPPRSLATWGYVSLVLSVAMLTMFFVHPRLFRKPVAQSASVPGPTSV